MKQITITQTKPFNGITRHADTDLTVGPKGDVSETDATVMVDTGMAVWSDGDFIQKTADLADDK